MSEFLTNFLSFSLWRNTKGTPTAATEPPVQNTQSASPSKRRLAQRRGFARRNDGAQTLTHMR